MQGVTRIACDGAEVYCLSDGAKVFEPEVFPELSDARRGELLSAAGETEIRTEFNAFLIHFHGEWMLVDAGCGALFGSGAGLLAQRMADLGVVPTDITRLVFTHMHGDHCGGALINGARAYPDAAVFLHPSEADLWLGKDAPAGRTIADYGDQIIRVGDGVDIVPGVQTWALPGHTPGHMGLIINGKLALVGDIFHSAALQLADPLIATKYDTEPQLATQSRLAALDRVVAEGLIMAGSHAVTPEKFVTLTRDGAGYKARPL
jgi:glyoxylase-like metal-dependent hydrolase (beta-lactamase superfamily II)